MVYAIRKVTELSRVYVSMHHKICVVKRYSSGKRMEWYYYILLSKEGYSWQPYSWVSRLCNLKVHKVWLQENPTSFVVNSCFERCV